MSSARWLFGFALALSLVPSLASADEPPTVAAKRRIEEGLVKPLAEKDAERSRFSRARMPPAERRVRITQAAASTDKNGREYLPFAIDVRWGSDWQSNDVVGCAYLKNGELFVKRGDDYRPASVLLGKAGDPAPGVCVAVKQS